MVVNARPLKRMKSRVTADLYDFLSFPSPSKLPGAFRTKVRGFLATHAMMPPPSSLFPHLMTWQIQFRVGKENATESAESSPPTVVCLDIIEEDVVRSRSIYCDQCRVVGWSGHPVCGKRYHFIIKADGHSIGGYHKPCICCGDVLQLSESKCKSCNLETNTDDAEDWVYKQLEDTTHLLHGVIHSNGYGHLLRVNGREGGSRVLSGRLIMDFWDRLCKVLGARKVSVMDVSIKYGLEYRLLHSITKGHPWYGDWGYDFGAGSFALTLDAYKRAIETLSTLPLSIFHSQDEKTHSPLSNIISNYQFLSENKLVNVRDLFCFVLDLLHDARKKSSSCAVDADSKNKQVGTSGMLCLWARRDVERVTESMLRVLRAVSGSKWVSRRSLKGAVYKGAAPELLKYCLDELGGKMAFNGTVVNARLNVETNASEYRLEARALNSESKSVLNNDPRACGSPSEESLVQDLRHLYDRILHPKTMADYSPQPTRDLTINSAGKLLDCKQFVKDYAPEKQTDDHNSLAMVAVMCEAELVDEVEGTSTKPPLELVVLPRGFTAEDLKIEASRAFRDVYIMFRRFQADELSDHGSDPDPNRVVRVRGRCNVKHGLERFRMERGVERWTVECVCGARDDDGERMSACDVCSVWHHTRCSGISDSDSVPARFVCHRCRTKSPCKDRGVCVAGAGFVEGLTVNELN